MAQPAYRIAQTAHGGPPERRQFTAGGTLVAGQLVTLQADGKVDDAGAAPNTVCGIATEAAADTELTVIEMVTAGTVLSANLAAGTFALADIGETRELNAAGIDADTDAGIGMILGEDKTDNATPLDPTTAATRLLCRVLDSAIQTTGSAL